MIRSTLKRQITKAISWRVLGFLVLLGLGWLLTGAVGTSLILATIHTMIQIVLYVLHERLWDRTAWGQRAEPERVIWLTGLPCAGKSTLAEIVAANLREHGRTVVVLDGDVLRSGLCSDLGFSAADRAENLRRVREVAKILSMSGIVVLVAVITPYEADRQRLKHEIPSCLLIWIDTSATECERRDVKGMWARAREGSLRGFTGVDDVYDKPTNPDVIVRTEGQTPAESAQIIMASLEKSN